uniref:Uncharacterized protein n=1 Tax=Oryza sativa subsp. japonica TaxID=39947 RepID=Q10L37_ORYSJ|nr:hypothetical protein LOC_Os03g24550 [Oryza sativa Japonica Group]
MAIKKCRGAPEIQGRREEGVGEIDNIASSGGLLMARIRWRKEGSVMTQRKPVQAVAVRQRRIKGKKNEVLVRQWMDGSIEISKKEKDKKFWKGR